MLERVNLQEQWRTLLPTPHNCAIHINALACWRIPPNNANLWGFIFGPKNGRLPFRVKCFLNCPMGPLYAGQQNNRSVPGSRQHCDRKAINRPVPA